MADDHETGNTTVTLADGADVLQVQTFQPAVIALLKGKPSAKLIDEGTEDGRPWATFQIPTALLGQAQWPPTS